MKKIEISLLAGMVITVLFSGISSFVKDYNELTENVFRLHILANSDSEEDQALKLKVRDEILSQTSYIFENAGSAGNAAKAAEMNIDEIEAAAKETVLSNGYDYDVQCEVTEMYFSKRVYDNITMPEGYYKALRVNIGEAEGKNWWCVMFPPLCLPAVTNIDDVLAEYNGVLTEEEIEMLQSPDKYEVKFYFVELYYKIFGKN